MVENLKVVLLQSDLIWENAEENRINFTNKLIELNDTVDLIVLPEMFTTGFSMNAEELSEDMQGDTVNWIQKMASQKNAAIVGSLIIKEEGNYFNRLLFVHPNGEIEQYDKRHTFTLAGEHKIYQNGSKKLIVNYKGWKICPLICYDLRFPVWARNANEYDLLIFVANWPKTRIKAWDILLQARAIENMSYCIGVNRIGTDGNDYDYVGHSAVYDMLGERIDKIPEASEFLGTVILSKDQLEKSRKRLNFLADQDVFQVQQNHGQSQSLPLHQ